MPISLHQATVGTFLRFLVSLEALIDKAEAHSREIGKDPEALSGACLWEDMWDFAKQVQQVCHHSQGAIIGARTRVFTPLPDAAPQEFSAMRAQISAARAFLDAVEPAELEAIGGEDMEFRLGELRLPFVVSDFLMGFSIPNFFFHVTTAYNILRSQGVPVGKRDYMGKLPIKRD